jgi:hypothetical protein
VCRVTLPVCEMTLDLVCEVTSVKVCEMTTDDS